MEAVLRNLNTLAALRPGLVPIIINDEVWNSSWTSQRTNDHWETLCTIQEIFEWAMSYHFRHPVPGLNDVLQDALSGLSCLTQTYSFYSYSPQKLRRLKEILDNIRGNLDFINEWHLTTNLTNLS